MNNINFILNTTNDNIIENKVLEIDSFINEINNNINETQINNLTNNSYNNSYNNTNLSNNNICQELDYSDKYSVKDLIKIIEYYGLPKSKMKKNELIQLIILYETDENNYEIVQRRKMLWYFIDELKIDTYLSKYILF